MSPFQIKCFKPGSIIPANAFFILSKGHNTGRPSFDPCPNCFVFSCIDVCELHSYYWVVYAMWAGGRFHPHLCGSVIEFIHLHDLKKLIRQAADSTKDAGKLACSMQQLIQLENKLQEQSEQLKKLKMAMVSTLFHSYY